MPFDSLNGGQEIVMGSLVTDFHDGVVEIGRVRWAADGVGLIKGRLEEVFVFGIHLHEHVPRDAEIGEAVAEVAPERDAGSGGHGLFISSRERPACRRGRASDHEARGRPGRHRKRRSSAKRLCG